MNPRQHRKKPSEWLWGNNQGPFEGNDIRISGGARKRCVICGFTTYLRLSHVIPKWAFKWHKEAWGGVNKTYLLSEGVVITNQDANKHYLLCESCEQRASVSEAYAKAIVDRHRKRLWSKGTLYLFKDRYWNLRIDLIAQFIAFIALRAHYANSVPLLNTKLPLKIRKRLRRICFDVSNLNDLDIAAWRFVPPKSDRHHDPREDIYEMYEDGDLGKLYILQAGGIEWSIYFDLIKLKTTNGKFGFYGKSYERVICLPYSEHRRFKYPEKWLTHFH